MDCTSLARERQLGHRGSREGFLEKEDGKELGRNCAWGEGGAGGGRRQMLQTWEKVQIHGKETQDSACRMACAGKAGNPFQTTQGNRLSCRDQEGWRAAIPGVAKSWTRLSN